MNKDMMRKHYETVPKETLINILIASREQIERLHSIIKEVREYIKEWQKFPHTNGSTHKELKNLIDILDKER